MTKVLPFNAEDIDSFVDDTPMLRRLLETHDTNDGRPVVFIYKTDNGAIETATAGLGGSPQAIKTVLLALYSLVDEYTEDVNNLLEDK